MIYKVYSCLTRNQPYVGIPIAQIEQKCIEFLIQYFLPGLSWMVSPQEVLAKGKAISKTTDGIYQLRASGGYKIVPQGIKFQRVYDLCMLLMQTNYWHRMFPACRRYAEEIRNNEHMTFAGSCQKDSHSTQVSIHA